MEKYTDYKMCEKCGGVCCEQNGCIYLPEDFECMDFIYLKSLLDEGYISISGEVTQVYKDMWTYLPYLRARNKDAGIVDLISNGGPCVNLTKTGCALSEEERPSFGLLLKPTIIGGPCETMNKTLVLNWLDYNEVLEKLVKHYMNQKILTTVIDETSEQIFSIKEKLKDGIQLTPMEKQIFHWYYDIMNGKPYYTPDEVRKLLPF